MKFTAVVRWNSGLLKIDTIHASTSEYTLADYNEEGFPDMLILPDHRVVTRSGTFLAGSDNRVSYLPALVVRLTDKDEAYRIELPSVFSALDERRALLSRLRLWLSVVRAPNAGLQEEADALVAEIDDCIGPAEPRKGD